MSGLDVYVAGDEWNDPAPIGTARERSRSRVWLYAAVALAGCAFVAAFSGFSGLSAHGAPVAHVANEAPRH